MTNRARQAEKIAEWSKKDLVAARDLAKNGTTPNAKREGRRLARAAKQRRARSARRAAKAACGDWKDTLQ